MSKVAHTLAVAEQTIEFEHRDLHWGNVLVKEVKGTKVCEFKLDGDIFKDKDTGCRMNRSSISWFWQCCLMCVNMYYVCMGAGYGFTPGLERV